VIAGFPDDVVEEISDLTNPNVERGVDEVVSTLGRLPRGTAKRIRGKSDWRGGLAKPRASLSPPHTSQKAIPSNFRFECASGNARMG